VQKGIEEVKSNLLSRTALNVGANLAQHLSLGSSCKHNSTHFGLLLIRKFTVGATIGRPQTTAKPKRATNGRPYKQFSAENLFSLPICDIMGLAKRLPPGESLGPRSTLGVWA